MKKSTFILILKILVAVAGAIVATLTAQSCSVTTAFGDNLVHNNISFNVNENEIFGVLSVIVTGKQIGRAHV